MRYQTSDIWLIVISHMFVYDRTCWHYFIYYLFNDIIQKSINLIPGVKRNSQKFYKRIVLAKMSEKQLYGTANQPFQIY